MKYSIEGIEKSKIIKSTQVINKKDSGKAIIVNYLDGTQDVFELNDENLNRIIEIAEAQGNKYIKNAKSRITDKKILNYISLAMWCFTSFLALLAKGNSPLMLSIVGISVFSEVLTIVSFISLKKEKRYLKKYQLYFEKVKAKLEDYQEILEKEKQLIKSKNRDDIKLDNVLDLDKVSLKQVQKIDEKVERYQEVEKQKVKKKENPSLY